ncbi:MAG: hypothetical protein AB1730_14980 [Myxococcota bacterium]|jgi:hypothetical protein
MEPIVTTFLKPSFQIAVQPGTGALEVQVEAKKPPLTPPPPQGALQTRWLSRH